jgi:hypothetical protein
MIVFDIECRKNFRLDVYANNKLDRASHGARILFVAHWPKPKGHKVRFSSRTSRRNISRFNRVRRIRTAGERDFRGCRRGKPARVGYGWTAFQK